MLFESILVSIAYVISFGVTFFLTPLWVDYACKIKLLGKENICEIHFKEGRNYLGQSGKIDWRAVVKALKEIGYSNWITLETSSPGKNIIADTQKNMKFVRDLFAT